MACLTVTPEIKELTNKLQGETEQSVIGLVSIWQQKNSQSQDVYPTAEELKALKEQLRGAITEVPSSDIQEKVDLLFNPQVRRDRVSLIARLFSQKVSELYNTKSSNLKNQISNATLEEVKALSDELEDLDRLQIIKEETPTKIFKDIYNFFKSYVEDSEENRIKAEFDAINASKGAEKYSEDQKLKAAIKRAEYKYQEYKKLTDDFEVFKALATEATPFLSITERVIVSPEQLAPKNETTEENENFEEDSYKDGWIFKVRETSSYDSLSKEVRKVISELPKLDYRGKYEKDDLGFTRYWDPNFIHALLMSNLKDMTSAEDLIPTLQLLAKKRPWVKQLINLVENNETLFSKFYQDFRKDAIHYWIQKRIENNDGTVTFKTIAVNQLEGIGGSLDSWRSNQESGTVLDEDSIYTIKGDINLKNVKKGLDWVIALSNRFKNKEIEEKEALLEEDRIWKSLIKLLRMVGVDTDETVIKNSLKDAEFYSDPIGNLLSQLNIIYSTINKNPAKYSQRVDLLNDFSSAYTIMARIFNDIQEGEIESSSRENDKTYYAHVVPNYLGKIIKKLKNVSGNEEKFEKFIQEEYKQYQFFYKNGKFLNDWVDQLNSSEKARALLDHKVVLNSGKVDYTDWDGLDYLLVMLNEYWSVPATNGVESAWYHVPILSDAPSAEFIKFRKYTNNSELDENGNRRTFQEVLLDKFTNLVQQEYDRIMVVRARDKELQSANPSIKAEANFDIKRDKKGKITSIGGAEFKFLPTLNDFKTPEGISFLDKVIELSQNSTGDELNTFIRETLNTIIEEGFEQDYKKWEELGLFEEVKENGKYKYLPFNGQSSQNSVVANSLAKAKEFLGSSWTKEMESIYKAFKNNKAINDKKALDLFQTIKDILEEKAKSGEIPAKEVASISRLLTIKNRAKEALREYYWNSKFATSQIIQITTTDLAYYKNMVDFQKRFKEIHAPANRLNTQATYNGEKVGREWERTIYLADDEVTSNIVKDVEEVIMEKYNSKELSAYDAASILSKFGYFNKVINGKRYVKIGDISVPSSGVNVADAQAYRSLSSYRAMMVMAGEWNKQLEQTYQNFKNGTWDIKDFNTIWQTKKPFVYTQVGINSGVKNYSKLKTPVQHKNSEFLLLAMIAIAGPVGRSEKLKAINQFMEDNNIDVVQFESTTKVGKQGVIDLNTRISSEEQQALDEKLANQEITQAEYDQAIDSYRISTFEDTMKVLKDLTMPDGIEDPEVVHKVSYEDYGIQTATPEHLIDAVQLIGTQIRKLITADMSEDAIIEVSGTKMTKKEWMTLYNELNVENILESFEEVYDIFKDPKRVEKELQKEIQGNPRYGLELAKACTLDENGQFNLPLFDPIQSQAVQTLLNSIIKNRVTKQKMRGGAAIQVSSYGLSDKLKIVFEGKGKNKRIKYMECYLPAYSKDFYEPLINKETGLLEMDKLPEGLRRAIGYRIPTEDKYSMAPLRIKGFLPQQNGSAIMLPEEITTLSGSDFDIDKLYIMLPEFKVLKYDINSAKKDFEKSNKILKDLAKVFIKDPLMTDLAEAPQEFKEWFKDNKDRYLLDRPKVVKVRYDYNKPAKDQSRAARNNALIDMMWGVLTNSDTTSKILNPGGFDNLKKVASIINILSTQPSDTLAATLKTDENKILNKLESLDVSTLLKMASQSTASIDPLAPSTQIFFHQRNMTGGKLIGVYANHNANHAIIQHTKVSLRDEKAFTLNGRSLVSLHEIKNDYGNFISRNNAGFLAASVDNVKEPVLSELNQNLFTADATMLLSRLGYEPVEIGLLMTQPIVKTITKEYLRAKGENKYSILSRVLKKTLDAAGLTLEDAKALYKSSKFLKEDLAANLLNSQSQATKNSDFYKNQAIIGILFKEVLKAGDSLGGLVQTTRSDTPNGAAGPTIADSESKIKKVIDFIESIDPIEGAPKSYLTREIAIDTLLPDYTNKEQLREALLNSELPFMQAFFTLGVQSSELLLGSYFPYFSDSFRNVVSRITNLTKFNNIDAKTINNIYNDLLVYITSRTSFFGETERGNKIITSESKRSWFINKFPAYFKDIVNANPDIAELGFIKQLRVSSAKTGPDVLVFRNVGKLSSIQKESYTRDWATLLHMNNPEANKLAINLFRYCYYRNGFAFGPSTFIHLAPVSLRKAIPGYLETLRGLKGSDNYNLFVDQYVYNHLDNRKIVPLAKLSNSTISEEGQVKDKFLVDLGSEEINELLKSDSDEAILLPYIATRFKGETYYYRLVQDPDGSNYYTRINPLGLKSNFIEYEYGKSVEEINTVIENKPEVEEEDLSSSENFETSPEQVQPEETNREKENIKKAFSIIYGAPFDSLSEKEDLTTIKPYREYEDADGNKLCTGELIAEL